MDALVSIIIPCYNHPLFIREAVLSAKLQTHTNVEVIVVDDGSLQPVAPLLGDFDDVLVFRIENSGAPKARNFGVTKSRGDYLVFLDSDDRLLPSAVATGLRVLSGWQDAGMAFGAVQRIDWRGKLIRNPHVCRPRKDYFLMLLESNPVECPAASMICRWAFVEVGYFDETLPPAEDYDLYLRMSRRARIVRHTECVAEYRQHSTNISSNKQKMLDSVNRALNKVENEAVLTKSQRKRLHHGLKRWCHLLNPQAGLRYRLRSFYFGFRAMLTVPLSSYFEK